MVHGIFLLPLHLYLQLIYINFYGVYRGMHVICNRESFVSNCLQKRICTKFISSEMGEVRQKMIRSYVIIGIVICARLS